MTTRIYKFLLNQVKSKYIAIKIIELSGNGYFFEYIRDLSLIEYKSESVLYKIIELDNLEILKIWISEILDWVYCGESEGYDYEDLFGEIKNTKHAEFWFSECDEEMEYYFLKYWIKTGNIEMLKEHKHRLNKFFKETCYIYDNVKTVKFLVKNKYLCVFSVIKFALENNRKDLLCVNIFEYFSQKVVIEYLSNYYEIKEK